MIVDVFLASGIAFAAFLGFTVFVRARRWAAKRAARAPAQPAFDVAALHAMLTSGQITQEEFDRLKAASVARQDAAKAPAPRGARGFEVLPPGPPPLR